MSTSTTSTRTNLVREATFIGNITRDPELRYLPSGKVVCSTGLAVNHRVRNDEGQWVDGEPAWFDVAIFDEQGENFADCIPKGTRVILVGRLDQKSFTRRDGSPGVGLEITVKEWGASGRWATMEVTRTPRDGAAPSPAAVGSAPADSFDEPF